MMAEKTSEWKYKEQFLARKGLRVPSKPDPPVVERVTFNSVTLSWSPPNERMLRISSQRILMENDAKDIIYRIQKANSLKKSFNTVYKGPSTLEEFALSFINHRYSFRVQCINNAGPSEWSNVTKVETDGVIAPEDVLESIKRDKFPYFLNIMKNYPFYSEKEFIEQNPLMAACANGRTRFADHLIHECQVKVNFQGHYGMTSLMEACKGGHHKCVELLLESGATCDFETNDGLTAVHFAALKDSFIMDTLLSKGAPPDIVGKSDRLQNTPLLHLVQNYGKADIAKVLLDHGADVNHRNAGGYTPLILAARKETSENLKLVRLFLEYGADPSVSVNNGFDEIDALGYAMAATNNPFHPLPKEMTGATKLIHDALEKRITNKL